MRVNPAQPETRAQTQSLPRPEAPDRLTPTPSKEAPAVTTSTSNFRMIDVSTPEDVADALGQARATLKDAQTEVAFLESLLKATGRTEILGAAFRVKIAYGVETKRTNWQKVAEFFSPPERLVAAHTSSTTSDRLTCSAHTKTAPKSKAKKDTKAAA